MNALKSMIRPSAKNEREFRILLGLVDYYLKTGKPVGSNTLKTEGFADLSSATIRNYFVHLEEEGYLMQHHASGGRVPTHLAFRTYAKEYADVTAIAPENEKLLRQLRNTETREIATFLQQSAESLSQLTQSAVFLSAPRFDQDYIVDLKLVPIDNRRCLCVIVTDFGVIQTETLITEAKITAFTAKRIESYFRWRLTGIDNKENLDKSEEELAQKLYNELMVRYIVNYSSFVDAELYRTGFAKLLSYPEFRDPAILSSTLGLFENSHQMRMLIKECCKINGLKYWIGNDLSSYTQTTPDCTIIAIPYYINQNIAGAIGLMGPTRVPYQELFGIIKRFSNSISEALTRNLFKFKISFRQPHTAPHLLEQEGYNLLLLEEIPKAT